MPGPEVPMPDDTLLQSLTAEQREELERRRYVNVGDSLVWIEPGLAVRKEKLASLYYVRTDRGVFRVSRLNQQVVEV